ncbi:hypothetical protein OPQ81_007127 [Rhizoctonia solani]|nr:hypothetical protein OPQ81_007127 [Rhizoctonia solani]
MSNPDQAEYEDVADAFKSLAVSSRAKVVVSEDGNSKEKAFPPAQRTPYQPRYPAHRQRSEDALPISLRPNVPSSAVYPPPISMPTPHAGYLDRDPLATNPLPRPPALHPALPGDLSILDPSSPPSRIPWPPPPPITPYRPGNDPYLNGFSTPQPPRPDPVSPPPKKSSGKPERPRAASGSGVRVKSNLAQRWCTRLLPTGFYSHAKVNTWITFAEWIPSYLQPDTQAALRAEMEKPASASDKDGYIYAYEIRNPKTPNEVHIKVGRAVNLVKRLDEWSKQCVSREVIIRGWWPGTIEENNQDDSNNSVSLLKGKINPGEKGKYCHRLERLIHLELSDVALNSAHLTPEFNKKASTKKTKSDANASPSKAPPASKLVKKPCPDCGAVHKEIFTLERVGSGKMKGREWEDVVQPIIEKWGKFVTEYV